jgi:RimJ/RimL family protein N-acetyltransferase
VIVETQLRDRTRGLILPLRPGDREAVSRGYDSLSAESREHRFLASVPHLTAAMLDHLVGEVDGVDHVALVLVVLDEDNRGTPVGVARMVRYRNDPTAADVAVTVLDRWHGRGVATALLRELLVQRPAGVTHVVTAVAADNAASLAMLRRLGECVVTPAGENRLDVVVDLPAAPAPRHDQQDQERDRTEAS